jgi:hypothetical protein
MLEAAERGKPLRCFRHTAGHGRQASVDVRR